MENVTYNKQTISGADVTTSIADTDTFLVFRGNVGKKVEAKVLKAMIAPGALLRITSDNEVTITNGDVTLTGTSGDYCVSYGTWTITAGGSTTTVTVDTVKIYKITI